MKNLNKKITILSFLLFLSFVNLNAQTGNTKSGTSAGTLITTGDYNVVTGYYSGKTLSSGSYNSFHGALSGQKLTSGKHNVFTGYMAGYNNSGGSDNTLIGSEAGAYSTSNYNTFIGSSAGLVTTSEGNSFMGANSGMDNTSGKYNTFIGMRAGFDNTSGSYNLFLGYDAGDNNKSGTFNICIGHNSYLQFDSLTNATAIGAQSYVSASNSIVLGNNANVGIGTSAPAYQLQLSSDNAAKPGSSTWTIASDKRLKKDITEFREGLSVLEKINPVSFKYNGEANMPTTETYIGIIAQEMKEIAPYTVGKFSYQDSLGNKTEYLDYDANAVTYIMINAIKELSAEVKSLKEQLANLNPESSTQSSIEEKSYLLNDAKLEQNAPNPFNENTCIKYYFPENASKGQINIYSMNGSLVKSIELNEKGNSSITIQANLFHAGIYNYELVIDNSVIEKLQMILTK